MNFWNEFSMALDKMKKDGVRISHIIVSDCGDIDTNNHKQNDNKSHHAIAKNTSK